MGESDNNSWKKKDAAGQAFLFSLPYFILSRVSPSLPVLSSHVEDCEVRLYPPFKSATNTFTGTPDIDPTKVPFLRPVQTKSDRLAAFAVLPTFEMNDRKGQPIKLSHLDSIRIDVVSPKTEDELSRVARKVVDAFIKNLRVGCMQWWLGHPYAVFTGELRNVFSIDSAGMALGEAYATGLVTTFGGFERPMDVDGYKRAFTGAVSGVTPSLIDQMVLDGVLEANKKNHRKAVMEYAIALEMCRDAMINRVWNSLGRHGRPRKGTTLSGQNFPKHLDTDLMRLCGRSLKAEDEELWTQLAKFWLIRNEVAHGSLAENAQVEGRLAELGDARVVVFRALQWMRHCD